MLHRILLLVLLSCFVGFPVAAQEMPSWSAPAQRSAPSGGAPPAAAPDLPDDPSPVPVDGGLALLALAGAGYAVRRLRAQS